MLRCTVCNLLRFRIEGWQLESEERELKASRLEGNKLRSQKAPEIFVLLCSCVPILGEDGAFLGVESHSGLSQTKAG